MKAAAALLGPSGVGLLTTYQSILDCLGRLAGMGLRSSAVRQVAELHSAQSQAELEKTQFVLERTCWITGAAAWALAAALAVPLSQLLFSNLAHASAIAILGSVLLLDNLIASRSAVLQGTRQITRLSKALVGSSIVATGLAVPLYRLMGTDGLPVALIAAALVHLGLISLQMRRQGFQPRPVPLAEARTIARRLLSLGAAFLWTGVVAYGANLAIRGILVRSTGLDGAGLYSAAWSISGLLAMFVLSAMGQDFYPRLTGAINDHALANRYIQEQLEVSILLALPGLAITGCLAGEILPLLYTADFDSAKELVSWLLGGVFLRVLTWPIAFAQHAAGAKRYLIFSETFYHTGHFCLVLLLVPHFGPLGAALAFCISYALYIPVTVVIAQRLTGFDVKKLPYPILLTSITLLLFNIVLGQLAEPANRLLEYRLPALFFTGAYCVLLLAKRTPAEGKLRKWIQRIQAFL